MYTLSIASKSVLREELVKKASDKVQTAKAVRP